MTTGSDEQRPAPQPLTPGQARVIDGNVWGTNWSYVQGGETRYHFLPAEIATELVAQARKAVFDHLPPVPESLPVGTDSARAEAERRWPEALYADDVGMLVIYARARNTFILGAEWARQRRGRREVSEAMTVAQAREELFDEIHHSWRCAYEPDPDRPGKERAIEKPRPDTCACFAQETISNLEEAVRAEERAARASLIEELNKIHDIAMRSGAGTGWGVAAEVKRAVERALAGASTTAEREEQE